jgi:hypothetical protein
MCSLKFPFLVFYDFFKNKFFLLPSNAAISISYIFCALHINVLYPFLCFMLCLTQKFYIHVHLSSHNQGFKSSAPAITSQSMFIDAKSLILIPSLLHFMCLMFKLLLTAQKMQMFNICMSYAGFMDMIVRRKSSRAIVTSISPESMYMHVITYQLLIN